MPYLTPNSIPPGKICRVLRIPNDPDIIACVTGAIEELTFLYNWEQYGAVTPDEMVAAMTDLFDNFVFQRERCRMLGVIMPFATTNPPDGTLRCDGTVYQRVDYPALYAVLGAAYILNADQFVTPDCRAKVVAGSGNYDGFDFTLYNFEGASEVTLDEFQIPSHAHSIDLFVTSLALAPGELPVQTDVLFNTTTGFTGGGQAHPNIQPTIVLDYCIVAEE